MPTDTARWGVRTKQRGRDQLLQLPEQRAGLNRSRKLTFRLLYERRTRCRRGKGAEVGGRWEVRLPCILYAIAAEPDRVGGRIGRLEDLEAIHLHPNLERDLQRATSELDELTARMLLLYETHLMWVELFPSICLTSVIWLAQCDGDEVADGNAVANARQSTPTALQR